MIAVLSKPRDEIDISDIENLIDSQVPEGEQIEFKRTLPAKRDDSPDPWISEQKRIGDWAKSKILEEAVAFGNAHGGALLLGIGESESKPPVAAAISPIPRCAELAERLKLVFRDCVEPQLPVLDIFAVTTEDESGVVIIRVGRSRLAPHRVTKTLVCPVRRADRCEEMTMREVQDMTLNVTRGLERLVRRLSERSDRFEKEFQRLKTPGNAFGFRMTAAPVGDEIWFDRVFWDNQVVNEYIEPWHKVFFPLDREVLDTRIRRDGRILTLEESMKPQEDKERELEDLEDLCILPDYWRPILRGARAELDFDHYSTDEVRNCYRELHCDGLLEWGFVATRKYEYEKLYPLSFNLPVVTFANLAVWADRVRRRANTPTAEYALEVELCVKGGPVSVVRRVLSRQGWEREQGKLQPGLTKFPGYRLDDRDEIHETLALFDRDFWNFLGKSIAPEENILRIKDWPG